jgi:hypothetical protein
MKLCLLALLFSCGAAIADFPVAPKGTDANTNSAGADVHLQFAILEQSTGKALITPPQPGTEGNKYGFEGGRTVKIGGTYHWITTEMVGDPKWVKTKLAYWTSTDRYHWTRVRTLYEGTGDYTGKDMRSSVWGPQMVFNEAAKRWELFYVIYRGKPNANGLFLNNHDGRIVRAVSTVAGLDGVGGPYKDIGVIMEPGKDSAPWEGIQGVDAFFPYQVGEKWYALHNTGAHDKKTPEWAPWRLGLAVSESNSLEGPWKRLSLRNPVPFDPKVGQENAIVTKLKSGRYVVVFDAVDTPGQRCLGYAVSDDGVHWSKAGYIWPDLDKNKWITEVCTPLGLIDEGDGVFTLFYTGRSGIPGGWDSLAYLKLKLIEH